MADQSTIQQAASLYETIMLLKVHLAHRLKASSGADCTDMTMPQLNTMLVVKAQGPMTIRQLSEQLKVAPPSASTMVDRLVETGMLRREPCPGDRRAVNVEVTAAGEEGLRAMEEGMLGVFSDLLEYMGPQMAAQWLRISGKIRARISELEGLVEEGASDTVEV